MANTIALGLAVGLAAGAAGAGVATVLQGGSPPTTHTASLEPGDDGGAGLAAELKAMREANEALQERLRRLESNALMGARMPVTSGAPQEVDMDALKSELEQYLASLRSPAAGPPKHFEQWVEASMEAIDERQDAEREAQRKAEEDRRFEERLTQMTNDLGLDNIQSGQMRKTLESQRLGFADLREAARAIDDRRESFTVMREGFTALNESTTAALQGFLSPAQFESYTENFQDNGFGGRGGPGGGRGGFGGGRGGGGNGGGF
jgi:hypothetical protein